jgi:hypothetical protein
MALEPIQHKRGDTFFFQCDFEPSATGVQSFAGMTVTSHVQTSDGIRHPAVVTMAGSNMSFTVEVASTGEWTLGPAEWDFKLLLADQRIKHTQTIPVSVVKQITL